MQELERTKQPPFQTIDKINILKAKEQRLKNNLPFYIINAGTQDILKIDFIFSAGSWYETSPLIAAATNSMLSEGTKKLNSAQLAEKLDYYGVFLNLDINKDNASLKLYSLSKYLPQILDIVEDIIKNPIFPEKEFETLIKKSKQQFIIERAKVNTMARIKFAEVLFGKHHPYGKPVQLIDYDNLTKEQLFQFHRRYYIAGNCKIIISGKINTKIIELIENHFGSDDWDIPAEIANKDYNIQSSKKKKYFVKKENALQAAIRIGKVLFNKRHPDFIKMQVLNTILGGFFGSRLMKNIRENKGYTYGISSLMISLINSGYLVIVSEIGTEVCKKAVKEVYFEINKLKTELVPEEELRLVKNYMLGDLLRMFDGPFALAESFESILEYGLDYSYFDKLIQTIKNITSEELNVLANKYLNEESMMEIIAGEN